MLIQGLVLIFPTVMKVIPVLVISLLIGRSIDGADKAVKNRVIYELTDKTLDVSIKKNYFVVTCFCKLASI